MDNFIFHNPVKVAFGKGQIAQLPNFISKDEKIMLTYGGGSIKKNGVYDQVIKALEGYQIIEFKGIEPNPKYETLAKAIEIGKKENVSFLLSVGGGSVLDGTKLIAAGLQTDKDAWGVLTGEVTIEKATPIGCILTLPATGSEMNANAVISKKATQEKLAFSNPLVMPKFSILDPETCFSLPPQQISNGIVDAFIHVMEQYLTYPVDAMVQDIYAESILSNLIELGPKVLDNPHDYDAMANFMWSATNALNGIIGSGVPNDWSTHEIGHELTAFCGLDHAVTLSIILPGVMRVMLDNKKDKILQYGARVWGINSGTEEQKIDTIIAQTDEFFQSLGIKTRLSDYKIGNDVIEKIVARFAERGRSIGEKGDMTPEVIREVLENRL